MRDLRLPGDGGSYLLWFYLSSQQTIDVGRLGPRHFKKGWYLYSGSAFGPGGLKARLGHHLKSSNRPHWHIDYLKAVTELRTIWFCRELNNEHEWSSRLLSLSGAIRPIAGFGSSDCSCLSHLVYVPKKPMTETVLRVFHGTGRIERRRVVAV